MTKILIFKIIRYSASSMTNNSNMSACTSTSERSTLQLSVDHWYYSTVDIHVLSFKFIFKPTPTLSKLCEEAHCVSTVDNIVDCVYILERKYLSCKRVCVRNDFNCLHNVSRYKLSIHHFPLLLY